MRPINAENPISWTATYKNKGVRPIAKFSIDLEEAATKGMERIEKAVERTEKAVWNRHPWNQKAKELLDTLPESEVVAYPEALYILQLAEWGLTYLPDYQPKDQIPSMPHVPRDTLQNDLYDLINSLMHNRSPTFAMEFMTETPWDESDTARPTVEEFQKLTEPGEAAAEILENLTERMRWWTAIPD